MKKSKKSVAFNIDIFENEKNIKKVLTVKNQHDIISKLSVSDREKYRVFKGI